MCVWESIKRRKYKFSWDTGVVLGYSSRPQLTRENFKSDLTSHHFFALKVSKLTLSISVAATAISLKKNLFMLNFFLRTSSWDFLSSTHISMIHDMMIIKEENNNRLFLLFFPLTNIPQMMIWSSMFANCFWLIVLTYARIFHFINLFRR